MKYIVDIPDNHEANDHELVMSYMRPHYILTPCELKEERDLTRIPDAKIEKMKHTPEEIKKVIDEISLRLYYGDIKAALELNSPLELEDKLPEMDLDEFIDKINCYIKKRDAIPGDEVRDDEDHAYVVTYVGTDYYYAICPNWFPVKIKKKNTVKTGIHFDVSSYIQG